MSGFFTTPVDVVTDGNINSTSTLGDFQVFTQDPAILRLIVNNVGDVGIGTSTPVSLLTVDGVLSLLEQASSPSASANYGKVYVKTNNNLYYMDEAGVETNLLAGGGGGGGGWTDDGTVVRLTTISDDVGIGTTTPGYKLDVNGVFNATAYRKSGNPLFNTGIVFVDREVPSGAKTGSNLTFGLAATPLAGSLHLYVNGVLQNEGATLDYQLSAGTITFEAGNAPQSDDILLASYRK